MVFCIKLPLAGLLKELGKAGTFPLPFRTALVVYVFIMDHVALTRTELPKRGELVFYILPLVLRGHSSIKGYVP